MKGNAMKLRTQILMLAMLLTSPLLAIPEAFSAPASASARAAIASPQIRIVRAGIPVVASSGRSETIRATLTGASSCRWISSPRIWSFDRRVPCLTHLARVAHIPANTTTTERRYTFTLVATNARATVRRHAVVHQQQALPVTPTAPVAITTTPPAVTTSPAPQASTPASSFVMSSNWSGYILPSSVPITEVSASWTVPTLTCASTATSDSSTWVGVGGATLPNGQSSGNLLQTGTDNSCYNGAQEESAWFELVPSRPNAAQTFSGLTISPGDTIRGEVIESASGTWSTSLEDVTTGLEGVFTVGGTWEIKSIATQATIGSVEGDATQTSYSGGYTAEWIVEDPAYASYGGAGSYVPFASYGTQTFSQLTTNLPTWSLSPADGTELVQHGVTLSTPSAVINDSFTCTYTGP